MRDTAAGLAALGRGPDSMLVHMSPREVAGLQQLAMAHGGSLTINPQTGLPEAGFLDKLLPTIIGAGLMMIPGMQPWGAGLITGGIQAARTGDIGKGLMAGLGAFGGAGLTGALSGMGAAANATPAALEVAQSNLGPAANAMSQQAVAATIPGQSVAANAMTGLQQLGQPGGFSQLGSGLMEQYGGKMGATAAGIGAVNALGGFEQPALNTAMPQQERFTGKLSGPIRRPYDPERNLYTDYGILTPTYAAKGGTLNMKDGGFVVPADVVSHLGNGDTDSGLQALMRKTGARPIKGGGDGMSDSIPASINGTQPARVASGEAYIDRNQVAQIGKGDQKKGSKKLYAMMDKVRKARTGSAKQGRQINPDRFVPA